MAEFEPIPGQQDASDPLQADTLVVGGGIAGMTTAIETAEVGKKVILVECAPSLGGRVAATNQYFPKLCPPTCGMEINLKRMRSNSNIRVLTLAKVEKVSGSAGDYEVEIKLNPRYVNQKCTCCGECEKVCEIERDNDLEDARMINKKIKAVLRNKMIPVLLVVEKEKKEKMSQTIKAILDDLLPYLKGISKKDINKIVIIYEPAWAIGTGSAAPIDHTYEVLAGLRDAIDREYGKGVGKEQLFQYGGGVTLDSAREIMSLENINGIGMGRAGLNLDFFTQAIEIAIELQQK